jgi:cobyrinic acid a,c-diamide synthase
LDAPVLLVVDAAASSRSVAAEVHGFATFDPTIRVAGVVLNRVGSPTHEQLLREVLRPTGIPVLGVLPRDDRLATPSRHLGLVPAAERHGQARATVDALADAMAEGLHLDAIVRLAGSAPPVPARAWDPAAEVAPGAGHRPVAAVAGGRAFTFLYTEHLELLAAAGADVVTFDPEVDESLPPGTRALVVGGGFPEAYVAELSDNRRLHADVRALVAAGRPVVGECGGLLYLCRTLDGTALCGVLPADATFTDRLVVGYREATATEDSVLSERGTVVRGHEFHRTVVTPCAGERPAWHLDRGGGEGYVHGPVHASYLHVSWVGTPGVPARLVASARSAAPEVREVAR